MPAGIFITQALHHANEHRAHLCTILGALGQEPPDVSGWGYALDTWRMKVKDSASRRLIDSVRGLVQDREKPPLEAGFEQYPQMSTRWRPRILPVPTTIMFRSAVVVGHSE